MKFVFPQNYNLNSKILGIIEMKSKNEDLDSKIREATKLASTDYQKKLDDLDKTVKEFKGRYDLVLSQMKKRNAPQAQYEQLEQIKKRWEIISKGN